MSLADLHHPQAAEVAEELTQGRAEKARALVHDIVSRLETVLPQPRIELRGVLVRLFEGVAQHHRPHLVEARGVLKGLYLANMLPGPWYERFLGELDQLGGERSRGLL